VTSAASQLPPTPPRNTTTTSTRSHRNRSGRSQHHAQQAPDAAISLQVKARMWWASRAGGGEDFAVLRSRGLHLPGQCKYTLQHANSHNSIAEMVGTAATVVSVGAASVYAMARLDGGSSDSAPPAAKTATKSSTTSVRLHTVGDYLVSTITHPHSCINMPWRRHN
jgi:hypothetical protein